MLLLITLMPKPGVAGVRSVRRSLQCNDQAVRLQFPHPDASRCHRQRAVFGALVESLVQRHASVCAVVGVERHVGSARGDPRVVAGGPIGGAPLDQAAEIGALPAALRQQSRRARQRPDRPSTAATYDLTMPDRVSRTIDCTSARALRARWSTFLRASSAWRLSASLRSVMSMVTPLMRTTLSVASTLATAVPMHQRSSPFGRHTRNSVWKLGELCASPA